MNKFLMGLVMVCFLVGGVFFVLYDFDDEPSGSSAGFVENAHQKKDSQPPPTERDAPPNDGVQQKEMKRTTVSQAPKNKQSNTPNVELKDQPYGKMIHLLVSSTAPSEMFSEIRKTSFLGGARGGK